MEEQIRAYIVENFLLGDEKGLSVSESLLDSGVVHSTGVIELIEFLEETFKIKVSDEELVPENLDTITAIAAYVAQKQAACKPGLVGAD